MLCASLRVESLFLYPLTRSLRPVELDVESVRTFRSKMLGFLTLLASLKPELEGTCKLRNCPSDVWQRSRAPATFSAVCVSANLRPQTPGNQSEKQVHCDCNSTITPPVTALVPSFTRLSGGCSTEPVGKHLSRIFLFFLPRIRFASGGERAGSVVVRGRHNKLFKGFSAINFAKMLCDAPLQSSLERLYKSGLQTHTHKHTRN